MNKKSTKELNQQFIQACKDNNVEQVKRTIAEGSDIHHYDNACLKLILSNGNIEMFDYVLKNGGSMQYGNHINAIAVAAFNGHLSMVKYLIEQGLNLKEDKDQALRVSAERTGNMEITKILIEDGADLFVTDHHILEHMISRNNIDGIQYLLGEYEKYIPIITEYIKPNNLLYLWAKNYEKCQANEFSLEKAQEVLQKFEKIDSSILEGLKKYKSSKDLKEKLEKEMNANNIVGYKHKI